VVESTRLESERTGNRTVGSNPTLSATPFILKGPTDMSKRGNGYAAKIASISSRAYILHVLEREELESSH
jgi:hypothetical protein